MGNTSVVEKWVDEAAALTRPTKVTWADGSKQELTYTDVANRLDWDKQTSANAVYDIRDIIAEGDKFALRFIYSANFRPTDKKIDVETWYFYHLIRGKVTEFWTVASADYDYKAKATEGMPTR